MARPARSSMILVVPLLLWGLGAACPSAGSRGEADSVAQSTGPTGAAGAPDTADPRELPPRGMARVVLGNDTVRAEVAATPEAREQGLMNRQDVPDGTGMLFVFSSEANRSFWMRNTLVPLDIAFLNSAMEVVDIQQMEPRTDDYHTSRSPAMFALEVPQGWFGAHGVEVGDQAQIIFGPR